jgi:hypothetical protein
MFEPFHLTDWITAVATALTAVAAWVGGVFGYLAYRRDVSRQVPVIEATIKRNPNSKGVLTLIAVARNRMAETIVIDSVLATQPEGILIAKSAPQFSIKDAKAELPLGFDVPPLGSIIHEAPFAGMPDDASQFSLYLFTPEGWTDGVVEVEFRVSSRALTIRDKRIVIKRRVTATKDAKAKS